MKLMEKQVLRKALYFKDQDRVRACAYMGRDSDVTGLKRQKAGLVVPEERTLH